MQFYTSKRFDFYFPEAIDCEKYSVKITFKRYRNTK